MSRADPGPLAPVGFVGLGAMGTPMSGHLLAAGRRVLGHDPSEPAVRRLAERGGTPAPLAEIATASDVVITSLPSTAAVRDVLGALAAGARDRERPLVVLETSTLALSDRFALREEVADARLALVDCPLSGTSAQAELGDLVAYLGGCPDWAADLVGPVLGAVCRDTHDVGDFGDGTRMKLVANLLVAVHNVAAAEALQLARRAGLDPGLVLEAVGDGAGASRMLAVRGPLMVAGAYEPATAKVSIFDKDLRAIRELAADLGAATPLLGAVSAVYAEAMAQGRADQDAAAVHEVLGHLAAAD
ncbi:2-hydroxy-3-oxopropionate reductase [Nocardioides lentus]|uniref:2-hydroxy-3-oxopropionate reductase n=1 Tax=Nocardioides lentus TaxID=338077 RepID=A0ABN2NV91_9ACTN